MPEAKLGLKEAIESLRQELGDAIEAGKNQQLQFEVGEIELEMRVEVEFGGEAGIRFWVVTIGASGSKSNAHTIRMPLTPTRKDQTGPILTGSSSNVPPTPQPKVPSSDLPGRR